VSKDHLNDREIYDKIEEVRKSRMELRPTIDIIRRCIELIDKNKQKVRKDVKKSKKAEVKMEEEKKDMVKVEESSNTAQNVMS